MNSLYYYITREYDFNLGDYCLECDFEFGIEFNYGRYFESICGRVTIIDDFDGGKDFTFDYCLGF